MQIHKYAKKDKMGGGGIFSVQRTKEVKTEQVTGLVLMRWTLPLLLILTEDKHAKNTDIHKQKLNLGVQSSDCWWRVLFIADKK